MAKREKKKWLLIQARIDVPRGKELQELADGKGLAASAYFRQIVIQHLDEVKAKRLADAAGGQSTDSKSAG